jgi:hypothetical protein
MNARPTLVRLALAALALPACAGAADAYPEFQKFVQARSGRSVNCAMCHVSPDGPNGAGFGQIGSLTPGELDRLNQARAAFEPGREVASPILNRFGNHIITTVGKTRFLQIRSHPEELAEALGAESDLDGDGIPDAREYLDGTHPLKETNGNPWLLFVHNLALYRFHLIMIVIATALTVYGLASLLRATDAAREAAGGARIRER